MKLRKCSFVGPISALILSVAGQLVNASPCDRWTLSGSDLYTATTGWEVGIGTTSPGAKLDVRGSAVFNDDSGDHDFRIESNGNTHMFFVDASADKVGIGTSSSLEAEL